MSLPLRSLIPVTSAVLAIDPSSGEPLWLYAASYYEHPSPVIRYEV